MKKRIRKPKRLYIDSINWAECDVEEEFDRECDRSFKTRIVFIEGDIYNHSDARRLGHFLLRAADWLKDAKK